MITARTSVDLGVSRAAPMNAATPASATQLIQVMHRSRLDSSPCVVAKVSSSRASSLM